MKHISFYIKKWFVAHGYQWRLIHLERDQFVAGTAVVPVEDFIEYVWMPKWYWHENYDAKGKFIWHQELKEFPIGMN